jgi:3-oxoacyl-[acyl-carrier protein] reductase
MDLAIAGRTALICGASSGLGGACAKALAAEGVRLVINGRNPEKLEAAASELRGRYAIDVVAVAADLSTRDGIATLLSRCPAPDILVNNSGGTPIGDWRSFEAAQWHEAIDMNMLPAVMLTRAVIDGMASRGFGRIVNITSLMVKQPNPMLCLSVTARLALTGFMKAIAATYIKNNVTVNNLLPENFATDRLRSNVQRLSSANGKTLEEAMAAKAAATPARRFGELDEFGATCAFYCSAQAGYLTAQNVMLDGGLYPALF